MTVFLSRAHRTARREDDQFSLTSAIRTNDLSALLRLADGRRAVVELGTGTGWSAVALALADEQRQVITYDPTVRPQRGLYLELVPTAVSSRIQFRDEPDTTGPRAGERPDFLFIDSAHDRESVLAAFTTWQDNLAPGAVVAFHDYDNPHYPGVREAVEQLGLRGTVSGGIFACVPPSLSRP